MEHDAEPRTLAAPTRGVLFVAEGKRQLDQGDRDRLVTELRAGRGPARLHVDAVVFRQDTAPNRAFVRFKPALLRSLAKSFVGAPFLRDHDQQNLLAVGGSIVASEFHGAEGAGEIRQTLELVKPWAIEAALDGTMSRFSIGWNNTTPVVCSMPDCGAPMFGTFLGTVPTCGHMPGDELEIRGGGRRWVEALVTGAEGVETSAVTVPAVRETNVQAIRAALSLQRRIPTEKNMQKLITMLGLTAGAGDDAIEAAVSKLSLDLETSRALLAAEREARASSDKRLGEFEAELAAQKKAAQERTVLMLETDLRKKIGKDEKQEAHLRKLSALSVELATEFVANMPQKIPIHALPFVPDPRERLSLDDVQRRVNRQMGISDEDHVKFSGQSVAGEK